VLSISFQVSHLEKFNRRFTESKGYHITAKRDICAGSTLIEVLMSIAAIV
jgi:hypothetical protein